MDKFFLTEQTHKTGENVLDNIDSTGEQLYNWFYYSFNRGDHYFDDRICCAYDRFANGFNHFANGFKFCNRFDWKCVCICCKTCKLKVFVSADPLIKLIMKKRNPPFTGAGRPTRIAATDLETMWRRHYLKE